MESPAHFRTPTSDQDQGQDQDADVDIASAMGFASFGAKPNPPKEETQTRQLCHPNSTGKRKQQYAPRHKCQETRQSGTQAEARAEGVEEAGDRCEISGRRRVM